MKKKTLDIGCFYAVESIKTGTFQIKYRSGILIGTYNKAGFLFSKDISGCIFTHNEMQSLINLITLIQKNTL